MTTSSPLTPEQESALLDGMVTAVRESQSPLRCFRGRLAKIVPRLEPARDGSGQMLTRAVFSWGDKFEVCRAGSICGDPACVGSVVPYPWQTAELSFSWGRAGQELSSTSAAGILAESINAITGKPGTRVRETVGQLWHVKFTGGHTMRRLNLQTNTWDNTEGEAYVCISLDGKVAAKPADGSTPAVAQQLPATLPGTTPAAATGVWDEDTYLVGLADGKTQAQFNRAAFTDNKVKADSDLLSKLAVSSEPVLQALVIGGLLAKDDAGIFHSNLPTSS